METQFIYIYISYQPISTCWSFAHGEILVNVPIDIASKKDDVATSAERGICGTLFVHKAWSLMSFPWISYGFSMDFLDDGFFQISFWYIICLTVRDVNKSDMSKDIHVVTSFNILSQYIDVE